MGGGQNPWFPPLSSSQAIVSLETAHGARSWFWPEVGEALWIRDGPSKPVHPAWVGPVEAQYASCHLLCPHPLGCCQRLVWGSRLLTWKAWGEPGPVFPITCLLSLPSCQLQGPFSRLLQTQASVMGLGVGTGFSPPPRNGHLASWLTPSSLLGSGQKEILGGVRQEGVFRCERVLVCMCVCVYSWKMRSVSESTWHTSVRAPESADGRSVCRTDCVWKGMGEGVWLQAFIKGAVLTRQDAKCFAQIISFNKCDSVWERVREAGTEGWVVGRLLPGSPGGISPPPPQQRALQLLTLWRLLEVRGVKVRSYSPGSQPTSLPYPQHPRMSSLPRSSLFSWLRLVQDWAFHGCLISPCSSEDKADPTRSLLYTGSSGPYFVKLPRKKWEPLTSGAEVWPQKWRMQCLKGTELRLRWLIQPVHVKEGLLCPNQVLVAHLRHSLLPIIATCHGVSGKQLCLEVRTGVSCHPGDHFAGPDGKDALDF